MKLIHKDGREAKVGDKLIDFRGDETTLEAIHVPASPESEGHVTTGLGYHYPSVYGLKFAGRKDR